ncbi:hypothetical protein D3C86_2043720 [compost metagenome]
MKAANRPTAMARATEWRLRCQRLASWIRWPRKRRDLLLLMLSGSGMYRLKIRRGIGALGGD